MLLQQIITILILLAWASTVYTLQKKKINFGEFFLWSMLWLSLLVASLFPKLPTLLSQALGIGRGVDLVIYASIFVLFFLMFKLYVRMEEQERQVTSLVRETAIRRAKKK
jgi:small membrane protein